MALSLPHYCPWLPLQSEIKMPSLTKQCLHIQKGLELPNGHVGNFSVHEFRKAKKAMKPPLTRVLAWSHNASKSNIHDWTLVFFTCQLIQNSQSSEASTGVSRAAEEPVQEIFVNGCQGRLHGGHLKPDALILRMIMMIITTIITIT